MGMTIKNNPTKKASLFSAILLSATCMVGSGWLFSSQLAAKYAGNWAFLSWFLAALLVIAIGICLSVVVAKFPVRGAITRSSALSHNSIFGMPFAFANWFGVVVTVATEAQATTQYISAASKSTLLMQAGSLTICGKVLALLILLVYLIINYYGIKLLAKVNNIITVFKIFVPLFTIIVFIIATLDHSNATDNFYLATNSHYGPSSAITAMIAAGLVYSFNGFQMSVAYASEIENPKRNVPLSIIISVIIVMILYMGLQYGFMGAIPHNYLVSHGGWDGLNFSSPLLNLAMLIGLNFMGMLLILDSIISPSAGGYTYLGATSRMLYAMASEGQMPRWLAKICPIHNFSKRSMLVNFILVAIMLWNASNWASLMVIVAGYNIIGYMAAPVSMGAIAKCNKTRIAGSFVFMLLGMLMTTMSAHDLILMNLSLTIIMIIYGILQIKKIGVSTVLILATPFLIYLWLLPLILNPWIIGVISIIFYWLITSIKYVNFCKTHNNEENTIED